MALAPPSDLAPLAPLGPPAPGRAPWSRRSLRLWLAGALVLAAIGFLLAKGLGSSLVYFKTANEAVADRAALGTATFQLEGAVVPGTVRQTASGVDFSVVSNGVRVPVANQGNPPQLFRPGIPVVVVGHFLRTGPTFLSDQIMVKHSASYAAAHPGRLEAPASGR